MSRRHSPQHAPCDSSNEALIFHSGHTRRAPPMASVEGELDAALDRQRPAQDEEHQRVEDDREDGAQEELSTGSVKYGALSREMIKIRVPEGGAALCSV